jgi:hypothetical protein
MPIRGNIYDIQDSPEKPAPKKVNHLPSMKQQKEQTQQPASQSPHADSHRAEAGPSNQHKRLRTQNDSVGAAPPIELLPTGRQTRSKAHNMTQNVPPTMPTETARSKKAKVTPNEPAMTPEGAPIATDASNQSSSRDLSRQDDLPEAGKEELPGAGKGESPEAEEDESYEAEDDEWSDYEEEERPRRVGTVLWDDYLKWYYENRAHMFLDQPEQTHDPTKAGKDGPPNEEEHDSPEERDELPEATEGKLFERMGTAMWDDGGKLYRANLDLPGQTGGHSQAHSCAVPIPSTLDGIFSFFSSVERSGRCRSEVGLQLVDLCKRSRIAIIKANNTTHNVASRLITIDAAVEENDQVDFKRDAYAYVFRALALYLQALHTALRGERGEVQELKDTPTILFSFIEAILFFKSRITTWKAKIPGRYKNDRTIKDINDNLIAPLRQLRDQVQLEHSRLAVHGRRHELDQARLREQRVRAQEMERREEVEKSEIAWRKRWHHLHVKRMQCERNITKRKQHLWFVDAPDLVERDSDGIPIERVSGLGHRTNPPPRWLTSDEWEGEDWTEPQDVALLETLQVFPGMRHGLLDSLPLLMLFCRSRCL